MKHIPGHPMKNRFIPTLTAYAVFGLMAFGTLAETPLLTGAYTDGALKGMKLVSFDAARDEFKVLKSFEAIENASFAVYDAPTRRLYVTGEADTGLIGAFTLSEDHLSTTPLGYISSQASAPCYLALSPDKSRLAVAKPPATRTGCNGRPKGTDSIWSISVTMKSVPTPLMLKPAALVSLSAPLKHRRVPGHATWPFHPMASSPMW
ncbi:MAG: hypothetical protein B7Z26_02390 [Asticcacaulis sp. 32-58-5]|nr:MAG: hypothetical protein B7Z26_02390 [Asticcacaulis sp. 32-58-5]